MPAFLLDSGLHVSDVTVTEAPAARDGDDAAPFNLKFQVGDSTVTAEGRWAATWAGNLNVKSVVACQWTRRPRKPEQQAPLVCLLLVLVVCYATRSC